MVKTKESETDYPAVTLRVPPETKEQLVTLAKKQERSVGWLVRKAIEAYLKEHK